MQRITIHIPRFLNDGSVVSQEQLLSYERELLRVAETARFASGEGELGFTVSDVTGAWQSPAGITYREALLRYDLDVADYSSVGLDVRRLAQRIRFELNQDAVYVTITALEVIIIEGRHPIGNGAALSS